MAVRSQKQRRANSVARTVSREQRRAAPGGANGRCRVLLTSGILQWSGCVRLDWSSYKRLCDRPDTWSRWMLQQTRELLTGPLAEQLGAALAGRPIAKPEDHRGSNATDMFVLELSVASRLDILSVIESAQRAGLTTSATVGRGLGGFLEAWREYAHWTNEQE